MKSEIPKWSGGHGLQFMDPGTSDDLVIRWDTFYHQKLGEHVYSADTESMTLPSVYTWPCL